jgi:hypothetical protein
MLVAVHTASRAPVRLVQGSNSTFFATLMFNAAASSNLAACSFSQVDENLEYNIWPHASHHVTTLTRAETPLRREIWNLIPTNR